MSEPIANINPELVELELTVSKLRGNMEILNDVMSSTVQNSPTSVQPLVQSTSPEPDRGTPLNQVMAESSYKQISDQEAATQTLMNPIADRAWGAQTPNAATLAAPKVTSAAGMAGMVGGLGAMVPQLAAAGAAMKLFQEPLSAIMEPIEFLTDIFGSQLLPAVQPLVDVLYSLGPVIEPIAKQFGDNLKPIMEQLSPIIAQLVPPLLALAMVFITSFMPFVTQLLIGITPLIPILVQIITFITPVIGLLMQFIAPIMMMLSPIGLVVSLFALLGTAITDFQKSGLSIVDWFQTLPQKILDAITGAGANFGEDIANWWNSLWD